MSQIFSRTSQEIYIEANGIKLAVVESYEVQSVQNSRIIQSFGEIEAIKVAPGSVKHEIKLSRVAICLGDDESQTDFYDLHNFNLVIVKPSRRIIYSGCEWSSIKETASISKGILEEVEIYASKRMEIA